MDHLVSSLFWDSGSDHDEAESPLIPAPTLVQPRDRSPPSPASQRGVLSPLPTLQPLDQPQPPLVSTSATQLSPRHASRDPVRSPSPASDGVEEATRSVSGLTLDPHPSRPLPQVVSSSRRPRQRPQRARRAIAHPAQQDLASEPYNPFPCERCTSMKRMCRGRAAMGACLPCNMNKQGCTCEYGAFRPAQLLSDLQPSSDP